MTFLPEEPEYRHTVVDLGTKEAAALDVFRKRGNMYFGIEAECEPGDCLGVDRKEQYSEAVKKKGYKLKLGNILTEEFDWPTAAVYLAFDFLEHLPSKEDSDNVLRTMLERSKRGVWLRMPSFEQDGTGEKPLRDLGMRFAWTHWHGHPSHYLVSDAMRVIKLIRPKAKVKHKHNQLIHDTHHTSVVPIDAPLDTIKYDPMEHGPKPWHPLKPPFRKLIDARRQP
jgi:hypothetical protein